MLFRSRIAGVDEAGRGPLVGAVVAAAVILNPQKPIDGLMDSKKLTEKKREYLFELIQERALAFGIAEASPKEIDEINILQASILAMHKAIEKLTVCPEHIIVDGNKFNHYKNIPHTTIVKGDAKFMSIAAASVLAKTYRDEFMQKLDKEFPAYFWKKNKGYPTKQHRNAIREFGVTSYHRKSFRLLPEQLKLVL